MQNLHLLIVLAREFGMDEARGVVVAAFCSVLLSPNLTSRKTGFNTLVCAIESSLIGFSGCWDQLLPILLDSGWRPSSLDFTKTMELEHLQEFAVCR
jgi:hypothetical protein